MYASKNIVVGKDKQEKECLCKICNKKIENDKTIRKRQRNIYCSEECALKGHKQRNLTYWTRKLRETHPLKHRFYA